ncbi:MAG: hypothetical protein WB502_02605 [Thermoactinomyces sp.]
MMKAFGFVDRGVPKVKMHLMDQVTLIMTLEQFAEHMKAGSPFSPEMNRLLEKILVRSRITHVVSGGNQGRERLT